jgi:peptide deformylase
LQIVHYPHPTLRFESQAIRRVDNELRGIARTMFDLMYEASGVGLAANQVALPIRMFVVNLESDPTEGDELVFVNPIVSRHRGGFEEKEEGCLSLPGMYAPVKRPKIIDIHAFTLDGHEIKCSADGLFGRVLQHENDHLDGVLFTDRISDTAKLDVREELDEFEAEYRCLRETGQIGGADEISADHERWRSKYC